ncbi:MAG TPA: hypothetical protein VFM93_05040 [Candidatus Limnocylindria bacterium]|nr:hypothetical protein [Candidatus Limnocylindria bacterium]
MRVPPRGDPLTRAEAAEREALERLSRIVRLALRTDARCQVSPLRVLLRLRRAA